MGGDRPFTGRDKDRWVHDMLGPEGSDKSVMEIDRGGVYMPDVVLPPEVASNRVVRDNQKSHFTESSNSEKTIRPWIYGSVRISSLKPLILSSGYVSLFRLLYNRPP